MIDAIRLFNDTNGRSHVQCGQIELDPASLRSAATPCTDAAFQETSTGGSFDWHTAPRRQYVITLSGVLDFVTRDGEEFRLAPGIVLVAEDTEGTGHRWSLVGDEPWRRLYVGLADDADAGFRADD